MKLLIPTNSYRRDMKIARKRGWDLEKMKTLLQLLEMELSLPENARPHKLSGEWAGYWECHIESDWLLIYRIMGTALILARTGTHADLFE